VQSTIGALPGQRRIDHVAVRASVGRTDRVAGMPGILGPQHVGPAFGTRFRPNQCVGHHLTCRALQLAGHAGLELRPHLPGDSANTIALFTMEQPQPAMPCTLMAMQLPRMTYVNATLAALSVIGAGGFGLLAPVTTPSGWFILAAVATAPALVFMHYWKRPAQTMSESIQEAIH